MIIGSAPFRKNIVLLAVNQVVVNGIPLAIIPFLMRTIGVEKFGGLAFAIAVMAYLGVLIEYGFNLSATKVTAESSTSTDLVSRLYSDITIAKLLLAVIATGIFIVFAVFFCKGLDKLVFLSTYLAVVAQSFYPTWLFQGLNRMGVLTVFNVIPKLLMLLLVLWGVSEPGDYYKVPIFQAVANMAGVFLASIYIKRRLRLSIQFMGFSNIWLRLHEARFIFLSQLKISLFSNTPTVIIGACSDPKAVAMYVAAEKIMRALATLQIPLVGSLFPMVASNIGRDRNQVIGQLRKFLFGGVAAYMLLALFIAMFSRSISQIVYGQAVEGAWRSVAILSIVPIFIYANNICGTQIMLNSKMDREFLKITLVGGLVNLIFCPPLSYLFREVGAAWSVFLAEFIVATLMFMAVKNEIFNKKA